MGMGENEGELRAVLGLKISDFQKKDTNKEPKQCPGQCGGSGRCHLSPSHPPTERPASSGAWARRGSWGRARSPGQEGWHRFYGWVPSKLGRALVLAARLPPPSSLASSSEGPDTPWEVWQPGWRGWRRAWLRPGPLFRKEGTDFSSGSRASHPARLPAPGPPEWALSTLFGD